MCVVDEEICCRSAQWTLLLREAASIPLREIHGDGSVEEVFPVRVV